MEPIPRDSSHDILAIKVHQWLKEWDLVRFDPNAHRRKPEPYLYLFSLRASVLRTLSGIYRRTTAGGKQREDDQGIQRAHDEDRSREIAEYVRFGYPWSELSEARRRSDEFDELRKPGWLPTALVVNILVPGDQRQGKAACPEDLISLEESTGATAIFRLPAKWNQTEWHPDPLPIEIIDGQHRLWAFDKDDMNTDFELPVVAFHGLDISWQAYLFWTINIKPKRINASLAFDMYPLLRTEDWLEKFEGHSVYRETRAQELTEAMWSHPQSPWYHRINMLGETGLPDPMVRQAAWIRSLMATYVKSFESGGKKVGGLFGAPAGTDDVALAWTRAQQAAFLIDAGRHIEDAVRNCREPWAEALRKRVPSDPAAALQADRAFAGSHSLLNTDQGIRGILYATNDLCFVHAERLALAAWRGDAPAGATDEIAVSEALTSLSRQPVDGFLRKIAERLATYDWRTSSAPGLTSDESIRKAALRGSGGYKVLRAQLLKHLAQTRDEVGEAAGRVLRELDYD